MAAFDGKYRNVLSEKYRAGEYAFGHISPASVGVWTVSGGMQGAGFTGYVSIAVAVCISMCPAWINNGVSRVLINYTLRWLPCILQDFCCFEIV